MHIVPPADIKYYKSPFLRDFWHLNVSMMTSDSVLIPDPDKCDILVSNPLDWPWLRLGLHMCSWGDRQQKYYLLGTLIIWWGSTLSLFVFAALLSLYLLCQQRWYADMDSSMELLCDFSVHCLLTELDGWAHFLYGGKIALYGWFLHYDGSCCSKV